MSDIVICSNIIGYQGCVCEFMQEYKMPFVLLSKTSGRLLRSQSDSSLQCKGSAFSQGLSCCGQLCQKVSSIHFSSSARGYLFIQEEFANSKTRLFCAFSSSRCCISSLASRDFKLLHFRFFAFASQELPLSSSHTVQNSNVQDK